MSTTTMAPEPETPQADSLAHARILVSNRDASVAFYERLGFIVHKQDAVFAQLQWAPGALLYLVSAPAGAPLPTARGAGVLLAFAISAGAPGGVDELARRAAELGVKSDGPRNQPWFTRELVVTDPDGYRLVFMERQTS